MSAGSTRRRGSAIWKMWMAIGAFALVCISLASGPAFGQEPAAATATAYAKSIDSPPQLAARLDRILADPALTRAHVGLVVQVAETGEVLYEVQGEKLFVPASNTKIVTAAVALYRRPVEPGWPAYREEP